MNKVTVADLGVFPYVRELNDEALAALAAACVGREFRAGELVIGHKDTTFDVYLLLRGMAQVSLYSADGQRVGFHEMAAGSMFGEISAIDGQPRSASVEASGPCTVALLPQRKFLGMIEEHPGFAMAVARQLAGRVRQLTTRVFEFSTMAVRQRLRAELLRLAERSGPVNGTAVIRQVPTHAELASRISTHREAVSREMAWLDANGVVVKRDRSLFLPDVARLRALLDESWSG